MSDQKYTALVAGGTGVVGYQVLMRLATSPQYDSVTMLARRPVDTLAGVEALAVDFEALCDGAALPHADHVYICLGTTQKIAGSKEAFRRVDLDYVIAVARAARAAGAQRLALVSSVGAAAKSGNFYLNIKGEAEDAIAAMGFERVTTARPGLLRGPREESRPGESVAKVLSPVLDLLMLGGLRRYHSIYPAIVAQALVAANLDGAPGHEILEYSGLCDWATR